MPNALHSARTRTAARTAARAAPAPPLALPQPDAQLRHPYRHRPPRHFIITHGRSGSSLLAAMLEDCGADFGPASARGGDTFHHHWECRVIDRAIRCAHNANRWFEPGMSGVDRALYKFWRSRAKALLRAGLGRAPYSKNRWNTSVLPLVERLGYRPMLIISYRSPAEIAMSDMMQLKNAASTFLPMIQQTYVDGLYALQRYGGVVIDHAELVDPKSDAWTHGLSAVTGFSPTALLASRNRLVKPNRPKMRPDVWLPPDLESVAESLGDLRNRPLAPAIW